MLQEAVVFSGGGPALPTVPFPGIPTTCDGAEAVVQVEINVSQAAGASDHQLDDDGRRVQPGRRQRRAESVGRSARVRRAGERAFRRHRSAKVSRLRAGE